MVELVKTETLKTRLYIFNFTMKETQITIAKNLLMKAMTYKIEVSLFISGVGAVATSTLQWLLGTSFLFVIAVLILLTLIFHVFLRHGGIKKCYVQKTV